MSTKYILIVGGIIAFVIGLIIFLIGGIGDIISIALLLADAGIYVIGGIYLQNREARMKVIEELRDKIFPKLRKGLKRIINILKRPHFSLVYFLEWNEIVENSQHLKIRDKKLRKRLNDFANALPTYNVSFDVFKKTSIAGIVEKQVYKKFKIKTEGISFNVRIKTEKDNTPIYQNINIANNLLNQKYPIQEAEKSTPGSTFKAIEIPSGSITKRDFNKFWNQCLKEKEKKEKETKQTFRAEKERLLQEAKDLDRILENEIEKT